jgi:hypothetical protein
LTRSSDWMPCRWRWAVAVSRMSSTPIRVANSRYLPSWASCRQRRSRSAGQEGSAVTTTSSLNGCGERSNTRRSTYVTIAMAGRLKSAWHASCGGIAMVDPTAPWGAELPMRSILRPNPVPPARG